MWQYLICIIETKSIPEKIYGNSRMVYFAEINLVPSSYLMLQHIGRVATRKLVPRNFLRYLHTILIMGGEGLVSEFMRGIAGSWNFWRIANSVLNKGKSKVNLLYFFYSAVQRCCLLHHIKQNCLLKTFLRTLTSMTQVSLYLFSFPNLTWNCIIFL